MRLVRLLVAALVTGCCSLSLALAPCSLHAADKAPSTDLQLEPVPPPPADMLPSGPGAATPTTATFGAAAQGASGGAAQGATKGTKASSPSSAIPLAASATADAESSVSGSAVPVIQIPVPGSAAAAAAAPLSATPVDGLAAPLYLSAVAGIRTVLLSWYPAEGTVATSGYLVFRGMDPGRISPVPINLSPVVESTFNDSDAFSVKGPQNRKTYYYRVRGYSADGRLSPYSDIVSATPNGPLLPPAKFEAYPGDGRVVLSWEAPPSTGDYDLSRLILLKGDSPETVAPYKILAPDSLRYTDRRVTNGKALFYSVMSEDVRGRRSDTSLQAKVVPYKPLGAPHELSAIGLGDDVVRLRWVAPPAASTFKIKGYNIYRSTAPAPVDYSKGPLNKLLVTDTKFEDESDDSTAGPVLGSQYNYTVVALDSEDQPSPPSAVVQAGPIAALTKLETGEITIAGSNTLQIQGRKTLNVSNTWIVHQHQLNSYGASSPSQFALDQQLQVRLSGQVGRKIKVDVDYDDKAAANQQQKISVVYTGDSQEVFKEFAFGDIQMDLTSSRTEFAGYNKSLFGAKLKLDSPDERLRLTAIGAQTQGFTETKNFVGGYEQIKTGTVLGQNYPDTAFIAYKYYFLSREADLVEGANNIIPGSVQIYIDEPGVTNLNPNRITVTNTQAEGGTTFNFIPLNAGVDYIVDNKSGLVTFNTPIQAGYNIAVAYRTAQPDVNGNLSEGYASNGQFDFSAAGMVSNLNSGVTGAPGVRSGGAHLIQYGTLNAQYDGHMSCQFYALGNRDIMDPKLDPDFKLMIYGPSQALIYQLDPRTDYTPIVDFDTRLGIMRFRVPYPFVLGNSVSQMTMDIPTFNSVGTLLQPSLTDAYSATTRTNNFTIHVEYKHKLSSYSLRFNIIHGSEVIIVDGRRCIRDVDYVLDYDTGILLFNNPDLVKETSTVQATYEYLPFGGQFTSTVWGARAEYDITKDLSVGTTYINDSANAPQETPDIKSGVFSLQVLDGDVQATVPQKALDSLTKPISPRPDFITVKASAEAAHSWFDPNTYNRNNENGVAMVDDFESVNSIVATSTLRQNWFPSSIPIETNGYSPSPADRRFSWLQTLLQNSHDAAARTTAGEDPQVNQLQWNWQGMTTSSCWDAFVYSFGPTPNQSISQSSLLNIWLQTSAPITIHIDVGQISEDAVDNGVLQTESSTGILGTGEDLGILTPSTLPASPYPPPQTNPNLYPDKSYWGYNNGILDTEDFDQTGVLDLVNNYYTYSYPVTPAPQNVPNNPNNGYQEISLDLTKFGVVGDTTQMSTVPGAATYYTNVSRVRIWVDGAGASSGTLLLESVEFAGNKWQVRADPNLTNMAGTSVTADTSKFQVVAVNGSTPITQTAEVQYAPDLDFYTVDSTHSSSLEQALEIQYALTALDQSGGRPFYQARRVLANGAPIDFGAYQKLRVDVYKPMVTLPGETFIIRLAADDQDYYEYSIPLDAIGPGGWSTQVLALNGSDGSRTQYGQPYLRQINYASFAIRTFNNGLNYAAPNFQEAIWVNNLRVTDAITREGTAQRVGVTYSIAKGAVVVNQTYHEVDSDFVKIDEQANPPARHSINQALDAKVSVIPWLPLSANYTTDELFTDGSNADDPLYSQNFTEPDQFDDKTTLGGSFTRLPGLTVNAGGYQQHIRQQFLPTYIQSEETLQNENSSAAYLTFSPNNVQNNLHGEADATYKMPPITRFLAGDVVKGEVDYDSAVENFDQPITSTVNQFSDTWKDTETFKGSYSGTYKWGKFVSWSPSYSVSSIQAKGYIPAPTTGIGGLAAYTYLTSSGSVGSWTPQSFSVNPALLGSFMDLGPVLHPKLSYNFTQTTDYVRNEMRTPGGLDLSATLDPGTLGGAAKALPAFDLTQSFKVDSTINNDVLVRGPEQINELNYWLSSPAGKSTSQKYAGFLDGPLGLESLPNLALEPHANFFESVWWVRAGNGDGYGPFAWLGENLKDPLNIENVAVAASRRSTSTITTHFDLTVFPGWTGTFTPRVGVTDARIMSAAEQTTENIQYTYGTGLTFKEPHIPFSALLKPQNLTLNGDYSFAQNYVDNVELLSETSDRTAWNMSATLPTRPTDRTTLTFSFTATQSEDKNYNVVVGGQSGSAASTADTYTLTPGMRLVYLLTMSKPIRLPEFWPFYGKELRLKQAIRLDNDLHVTLTQSSQYGSEAVLPTTGSQLYTLINTLSYNVLDNVKINFSLEQDLLNDPYANDAINQPAGYYELKLSLGMEATF